jgi:hypothetical protein
MRERAEFEAITRSLALDALAGDGEGTLRRGTLVLGASSSSGSPSASGPRRIRPSAPGGDYESLPRLDVRPAGAVETGPKTELVLGDLLGAGGMGAVFVARQRSLRRDVAVKRLREGPDKTEGVGGLLAEARIAGALEHPSIVPVHLLGVDGDGAPLLVMKRIEGATLAELARDPAHPQWADLERRHGDRLGAQCEILMRVADALHFAHSRGYFHRDVKPSNVMIGSFGEVYLVDWGVALHRPSAPPEEAGAPSEEAHEIVGTPAFMAPEMVRADPALVTAATDVYLLGATLHMLLTGETRHRGGTMAALLFAAFLSEPFAYGASVPEELGRLANRATSADPADRPATALSFREALSEFLRHRGSLRLTEKAEATLADLAPASGAAPSLASLATPETFARLSECRFALATALTEWPENDRAIRARERVLRLMIDAEIERRSADGAATLARELSPEDSAVVARIDALRAAVREARDLEAEGRKEREEQDLETTSRYRVPLTIAVFVLSGALFVWALVSEHVEARPIPMERVVPYDVVMLGIMAGALWIFRKRMLTNRLTRQLGSLLLLALLASTVADQVHASRGETSREAGALSVMMIGAVYLGAAIGIGGRLWYAAGICFASGIVAAIWPSTATIMVGVGISGTLIALVYDALSARKKTTG